MYLRKWLTYWKKSLSDSLFGDIDIDKLKHFEIENFSIDAIQIADLTQVNKLIDFEEERINKKKGILKKDSKSWTKLDSALLLIAPFKLVPTPERLVFLKDKKTKFPFWYYIHVNRSGKTSVPEDYFPVFQRKFLEPLADEKTEFIFSTVEKVDIATAPGKEKYKIVQEYIDYLRTVFTIATDQLIENYTTEGYSTLSNAIVLLPDEEINAAIGIIQLYEKIVSSQNTPPLLSHFISLKNDICRPPLSAEKLMEANYLHIGQMGFSFPLSISQRKSLYTFLTSDDKVFAINGPPGTGKTTLLQSVVANMIVDSAIKGGAPAIILTCSTNNQAVTNIIDSFSKSNTQEGALQGRWLPDIQGYATYLPSALKSEQELKGINYKKLNGEGIFSKIENHTYLGEAKDYFLEKGKNYFNGPLQNTHDIISLLQEEIQKIQASIKLAGELWQKFTAVESDFHHLYCHENTEKDRYYKSGILDEAAFEIDIPILTTLEKEVIHYFKNESFFRKLFCFLNIKSALRKRAAELKIILRYSHIPVINNFQFTQHEILEQIGEKIRFAKRAIKEMKEWKSWKQQHHIKGDPPVNEKAYWDKEYIKIEGLRKNDPVQSRPNCFFDELDISLRHKAFQLALHYWEGRWLLKLEEDLASDIFTGNNEEKARNRWTRQAMITPCFVSTFYMAPNFFTSSRFLQKSDNGISLFDNPPLYEFIDLLIVDEAGQVSPEVGIATFALARKAAIVGDVKQIEPVWNITNKIDVGNLKRGGLIKDYDDLIYEKEFDPKGFLASTGSIMKMAQNACCYQEDGLSEKGVLLIEHRRCYDEIISYCNVLAYNGLLKPLKGKSSKANLFPPMYCIHVEGHSNIAGTSRSNMNEVNAIVYWLNKNRQIIENKYGKPELAIGIITPFTGQKAALSKALKQAGFDTSLIKLGTVHALQGAERPVILFSMVYGPGDAGVMFFDRDNKPNMLNVAVSRAQDSFIVFANTAILNKSARTPSGILANHLVYSNANNHL
ncbi:AAA domain-containing protein [Filimonas lacunae]|nr:AAA domain-containing protein [Filimonas lacunae]BAV06141.1 superfamily I DNA helicases [Filimonas lacunae]